MFLFRLVESVNGQPRFERIHNHDEKGQFGESCTRSQIRFFEIFEGTSVARGAIPNADRCTHEWGCTK